MVNQSIHHRDSIMLEITIKVAIVKVLDENGNVVDGLLVQTSDGKKITGSLNSVISTVSEMLKDFVLAIN